MPYSLENIIEEILRCVRNSERSERDISLAAVGHESAIRSLKRNTDPRLSTIIALAQELGLYIDFHQVSDFAESEASETILPFIGNIAAGGSDGYSDGRVMTYAEDSGETVSAPVGVSIDEIERYGGLSALQVKGSSMHPVYNDGDMIYVYGKDPMRFSAETLIGKDCAVVLAGDNDGAIYLKRLRRSDSGKRDLFNLESLNPMFPVMTDVAVHNIMPVRHVKKAIP